MFRFTIKLLAFLIILWLFLEINNSWLQVTHYTVKSTKLPSAFQGFKIVQLSDLHDATFGEKQNRLIKKVKKENPDIVVITGDFIDSNRYNLENSLHVVQELRTFTDVFYVIGNHEVAVNKVNEISAALKDLGVYVLRNESIVLEKNGEQIVIAGIDDPLASTGMGVSNATRSNIDLAMKDVQPNQFILLLSHRPEVFSVYVEKKVHVVFTGHAHGGQVRIPGIGGLYAPGQGWNPPYSEGIHNEGDTAMIVSRGLGNSIIPYRVFNRPEIVVTTLQVE